VVLQDFPAGRFREAAVGTGEGAQAYGHGAAYLAESPATARIYSADRAYVGAKMAGKPLPMNYDDPAWLAQSTIDEFGDAKKAISHLEMVQRTAGKYQPPETKAGVQGAIDMISSGQIGVKGHLYKTDIPDEAVARMLDLDKPFSEQPESVRNAISTLIKPDQHERGSSIYGRLVEQFTGDDFGMMKQGQQAASKSLQDAGIPGIKYLDQSLRTAGEGPRDFVPFDENLIRILDRNGIPTGAQPWKPGEWQGLGSVPRVEQTAATYTLGDVTNGLPANISAATARSIDENALRALRVKATALERADKGISLYVTHDGKAIVSKPKGVKTPERLKTFAAENNLEYSEDIWRQPVGKKTPLYEELMPAKYRESGAKYHWE
jgi:hypothetical protein